MMAKKRTDEEWKSIFNQQKQYPDTVKSFCESIEISGMGFQK